jgi:hypothetical protein
MARRPSPCVFCGLVNDPTVHRCAGCGGPLGAAVGADPGPEPPPVPRPISNNWVWREVFAFPIVWGVLFGGIPSAMGCLFVVIGLGTLLIPFVFVGPALWCTFGAAGAGAMAWGIWGGWKKLALIRSGRAAVARVVAVTLDPSTTVDGQHPWRVQYLFDLEGRLVGGSAAWWDPVASQFGEGDRLHVVFDPADPSRNVPWPPPS